MKNGFRWREHMKVDLNIPSINQNVDVEKNIKNATCSEKKSENTNGYKVDISGTVMDNAAYGTDELKAVQDVMRDAGQQDVALQRNYMAVMSNSMSTEDFAKLQEEGYSPDNMTVETAVTALDRIKATLIDAGVVIEGFNNNISDDQLEEITGSVSGANRIESKLQENDLPVTTDNLQSIEKTIKMAQNMSPLSDEAIKYMLLNSMKPTIDNIYKSEYSGTGEEGSQWKGYYADSMGYYAKKAESIDWQQLQGQMEQIIKNAGLEVTANTIEQSKWLIEKGVPLTEEKIISLNELKSISLPMSTDKVLSAVINAISDGKEAKQAILSERGNKSIIQKALELVKQVADISGTAVEKVVEEGKELSISSLSSAQKTIENNAESNDIKSEYEIISAKRVLEETRLQMTTEATARLIKKGFSIETEPLKKVVEELKIAEKEYYQLLLKSEESSVDEESDIEEKIARFKETNNTIKEICTLPVAVLGKQVASGEIFSLSYIRKEGIILKATYDKANETYEAVGTSPRSDLGDTIKKAFQNIDVLLEEEGMETTEANRRAVRILGYNKMSINQQSIGDIKEADQAVQQLIEKMTPAKTINLIRQGWNPLDEDIFQLADKITETDDITKSEKYSEYLWKLEKNNEISAEERSSYIGIYRLFNQIEKSDGSVIGSVMQNGQSLTLKNLLSAVRSNKAVGVNTVVDDEYGILEDIVTSGDSISKQIEAAYNKTTYQNNDGIRYNNALTKEIMDKISPEKLHDMTYDMNTDIETFVEGLRQTEVTENLDKEYIQEQMQNITTAKTTEDYVLKALIDFDQPVTMDNILAGSELLNSRGSTFKQLLEQVEKRDSSSEVKLKEELKNTIFKLHESMDDETTAKAAYEELKEVSEKILDIGNTSQNKAIDVKAMNLLHKQISLATSFSKENNYEIPLWIGDKLTSINLKIIKGAETTGKVVATMDLPEFGKVAAEFYLQGGNIKGLIACDNENGTDKLEQMEHILRETLQTEEREVEELRFVYSNQLNIQKFGEKASEKVSTIESTKELYEVAKAFITGMRGVTTYEN